jgi:hypothetical protein
VERPEHRRITPRKLQTMDVLGRVRTVLGAILVVAAVVVALPVTFMLIGLVASALIGWFAKQTVAAAHEGSELLETNY